LVGPHARRGTPTSRGRADDRGCSTGAEEGNVVSIRHKAYATSARTRDRTCGGDASFARSGGPCTSILTTHRTRKFPVVRRTREHHGWATSGNREKPALGLSRADGARLAACHRSRKGGRVACREKEGGRGLRPCEDQGLGFGCPHVDRHVAEVGRRQRPRIGSANAPQKGWQGRVNGGLAGGEGSMGETVDKHLERNGVASRPHR